MSVELRALELKLCRITDVFRLKRRGGTAGGKENVENCSCPRSKDEFRNRVKWFIHRINFSNDRGAARVTGDRVISLCKCFLTRNAFGTFTSVSVIRPFKDRCVKLAEYAGNSLRQRAEFKEFPYGRPIIAAINGFGDQL